MFECESDELRLVSGRFECPRDEVIPFFVCRREITFQIDRHTLVTQSERLMKAVFRHGREVKRIRVRPCIRPLLQFDLEHHVITHHHIALLSVAEVENPFVTDVAGHQRPHGNHQEGKVQCQLSPFGSAVHFEPDDVVKNGDGKDRPQCFEPVGFVDQGLRRLRPVVIFDERRRPDRRRQ